MLVLLKTLLKLDTTTTKRHLLCTRKGTPQNLVNMSGRGIEFHIKWQTLKRAKPYI